MSAGHEIHLYLDECGVYFSKLDTTEHMKLEIIVASGNINKTEIDLGDGFRREIRVTS